VKTRERIIMSMIHLLEVQGYSATGLAEINAASQTPKGSLYFHFPGGKVEIAQAAIRVAAERTAQKLKTALAHRDLGVAIAAYVGMVAEDLRASEFCRGCPVANVAAELAASQEDLRQACEQAYFLWFGLLEQRLAQAGIVSSQAKVWANLILSAVEGALLLSRTYRSTEPLDLLARQLPEILPVGVNP
jgi:TetR/AcrR family transcriptional repressor of lmrAB and yxaGH operons